jgi:glycosyltransferase involved in cell wall biosynthesis
MIKVLYDGWSLVRGPNSPEGLHLLCLLQPRHPQVQAYVALPDQPPSWLPAGVETRLHPIPDTPRLRLAWEQRSLPRMAGALGADLLHLTALHPPLLGSVPCVVSPADYPHKIPVSGFFPRLREALASGGISRLRGLLWPSDLGSVPPPVGEAPAYHLPLVPCFKKGFASDQDNSALEALQLPDTYILYHGPGDKGSLQRLLDAWSWAAGAIGEYYPLLVLGLDQAARQRLQALLRDSELKETIRALPVVDPADVHRLYQGCSAVFHPAHMSPWGAAGWLSLLYGKPLVAAEDTLIDALAGPAAYLLPEWDTRGLGAALITVIVEQQVAEELSQAGRQRAATWDPRSFQEVLFEAYQAVLSAG